MMKILFFAPHSAIWIHAFPEALVADALRSQGNEIVYVSCGQAFEQYCVPMSANRLLAESPQNLKSEICRRCAKNEDLLRTGFKFSGPSVRSTLTSDDLRDVERVLATFRRDSVSKFESNGIPVGKIALYQLLLRTKKFDLDFNEQQWAEYLTELRNTLYSIKAAERLFDLHKPDRILVYNGLYSVNRVACLLAESRGIPSYFIHAGANLSNRLQTLMIGRGNTFDYMPKLLEQWPRFSSVASDPGSLSAVTNHFLEQLRGRNIFVYSKEKSHASFDAKAIFGVRQDQKLIVATMSSNDEELAGVMVGAQAPREGVLFLTQIDWILATAEFVRNRPDLFLVVRVHPREFPNRRDEKKSQHAYLLESALADLPSNAAVNWPEQKISLYDLVDQTDVFLNAWSSAGKDIPILGVPVVTYSSRIQWYPADLNYVGETLDAYFAAIDQALADGWSFEIARRAYRWAAFEFVTATISISDSYRAVENPKRTLFERLVSRARRSVDPDYEKRFDVERLGGGLAAARQINDLLENAGAIVAERVVPTKSAERDDLQQETDALRGELKKLANAMFVDPNSRSSRLYRALCGYA
jgi:hypothetical protein